MMRPFKLIYLFASFFYALVESNLILAYDILTPGLGGNSDIILFDLKTDKNLHLFFLTCMITMTPGTLCLKIDDNRKKLHIHSLYCDNPDEIKASIAKWEKLIMEIF